MNRTIATLSVLMVVALVRVGAAANDKDDVAPCKSHPTMTLLNYLAQAYDETYPDGTIQKRLPDADYRMLAPKGLKIDNRPAPFFASDGVASEYPLPAHENEFASTGGYRFLGKFMSPCRVQDPDGRWWVVVRHRTDLGYIPSEKTEEEKPPPKK
jgi:hypothetical protein